MKKKINSFHSKECIILTILYYYPIDAKNNAVTVSGIRDAINSNPTVDNISHSSVYYYMNKLAKKGYLDNAAEFYYLTKDKDKLREIEGLVYYQGSEIIKEMDLEKGTIMDDVKTYEKQKDTTLITYEMSVDKYLKWSTRFSTGILRNEGYKREEVKVAFYMPIEDWQALGSPHTIVMGIQDINSV